MARADASGGAALPRAALCGIQAQARVDQLEAEVKSLNYKLSQAEAEIDALDAEKKQLQDELEKTLRQLDDI